ncbi:P-loop containing nucleoside triphosphatehydrolases superfamily protein [Striga asiatica]|uniref:P-loop containing nucleoside triphosphatehydrolases superfamily protein n=1 Tax=Striga asiatica TaxID=4170 RepID=A0A5A7Q6P3_STRAF|nr:P-loop containing nucleoside triphosphatehydrolases superfamily protein [Striga asiatica]
MSFSLWPHPSDDVVVVIIKSGELIAHEEEKWKKIQLGPKKIENQSREKSQGRVEIGRLEAKSTRRSSAARCSMSGEAADSGFRLSAGATDQVLAATAMGEGAAGGCRAASGVQAGVGKSAFGGLRRRGSSGLVRRQAEEEG